jgi:hypothetical protein
MVKGNEIGLTLKPAPVTVTAEITRSAFPVLLTTTVFVLLVPTVTLPNESAEGFTLNEIVVCSCVPAAPPTAAPVLPHPEINNSKMATAATA